MRSRLFIMLVFLTFVINAQQLIIKGTYIGNNISQTSNSYFLNKRHLFVCDGDTAFFNVKLQIHPGDTIRMYDPGLFGDCFNTGGFPQKGQFYKIALKIANYDNIPFYSYYKINWAEMSQGYEESYQNNAYFQENGFPHLENRPYVDIGNQIYEIVSVNPPFR